ncbi:discoidin domain-containing protein [Pedobacter sp.]|jgi:hypothetical protein|uniref:discoidin domain-containing protein n=1 Tax=Pedobacter sp. TaxID=1411316 RepID=UPI002C3F425B|nr:discoidin domain-containing protein [Pedobacter sp.]HWW42010.1 discoidin domain-containing protein [Pedobacter sp.]
MKTYKLNLLAICTVALLFMACKKDKSSREVLAEGRVSFNLPVSTEVVASALDIKNTTLVTTEMKAVLQGATSSDVHYVTFTADTTKIAEYRAKYGSSARLLPTSSYLFYKSTVAIPAGTNISESAVLNLSFQTVLKARTAYVLPLAIASVDGQVQDPKTRRVVYYVFNTGDAVYVDHTGYTLTATASSTNGGNVAGRAVDGNTLGTYWLSNITQSLPQWISIDFGREINFSGLDYFFPTAANYQTLGGNTTSVKLETSSDNTTWIDKGTYAVDIKNTARKQTLNLPSLTTARYLRFTILAAAPYSGYSVGFIGEILMRN